MKAATIITLICFIGALDCLWAQPQALADLPSAKNIGIIRLDTPSSWSLSIRKDGAGQIYFGPSPPSGLLPEGTFDMEQVYGQLREKFLPTMTKTSTSVSLIVRNQASETKRYFVEDIDTVMPLFGIALKQAEPHFDYDEYYDRVRNHPVFPNDERWAGITAIPTEISGMPSKWPNWPSGCR